MIADSLLVIDFISKYKSLTDHYFQCRRFKILNNCNTNMNRCGIRIIIHPNATTFYQDIFLEFHHLIVDGNGNMMWACFVWEIPFS